MGDLINKTKKQSFTGDAIQRIAIINVILFVFLSIVFGIQHNFLGGNSPFLSFVLNLFCLQNDTIFYSNLISVFTYFFSHLGFWHLVGNLFGLLIFGQVIQNLLGNFRVWHIYMLGGIISGAVVMLLNLFLFQSVAYTLIGASTAIFALMSAATYFAPNYIVYLWVIGPVRIKYLTLVLLVLRLVDVTFYKPPTIVAHVVGLFVGVVYIFLLQKGWDINDVLFKIKTPSKLHPASISKQKKEDKILATPSLKEERLNEILDKIKQSGFHSLSPDEKEFLKKYSDE